jgi:hypothetical protein
MSGRLHNLILGLADRVHAQSELLSGKAEKRNVTNQECNCRFKAVLKEMGELSDLKQKDYGTDDDPFANVRAAEEFGIPAFMGAVIRLNDKVTRLKAYARNGTLANEGVEDNLIDIANYAVIALILFRERQESGKMAAKESAC